MSFSDFCHYLNTIDEWSERCFLIARANGWMSTADDSYLCVNPSTCEAIDICGEFDKCCIVQLTEDDIAYHGLKEF
jgi:hypothetical protein